MYSYLQLFCDFFVSLLHLVHFNPHLGFLVLQVGLEFRNLHNKQTSKHAIVQKTTKLFKFLCCEFMHTHNTKQPCRNLVW